MLRRLLHHSADVSFTSFPKPLSSCAMRTMEVVRLRALSSSLRVEQIEASFQSFDAHEPLPANTVGMLGRRDDVRNIIRCGAKDEFKYDINKFQPRAKEWKPSEH